MLDSYTKITVGDKTYPIAFTLNTMEKIQLEYGSFEEWYKPFIEPGNEISYKDLIWSFEQIINEGIAIDNNEGKSYTQPITHQQAGWIISKYGQLEAIKSLFEVVGKSMPKADDSKNSIANPTQQ